MVTHTMSLEQWAGANSQVVLAVCFTDISASTILNSRLGDEAMSEVRDAHFTHARMLSKQYDGYLVKKLGDGLLVAFHAATNALDFMLSLRANTGHELVEIHAGIDVGPVLIEDDDIYGSVVNYAARLEGEAKRGEIFVSTTVKSHIDVFRAKRHAELKWAKHIRKPQGFGKGWVWSVTYELVAADALENTPQQS